MSKRRSKGQRAAKRKRFAPAKTPVMEGTRFEIPEGTLQALKWLALVLMTLDHVNKYFFDDKLAVPFALGRMVMPLFGFILAYNLARPGLLTSGAPLRIIKRLALFGLLATPAFIGLGGLAWGWYPFNIMFMLLTATAGLALIAKGGRWNIAAAIAVLIVGGGFVEFWWFALGYTLAAYWFVRTKNPWALMWWILFAASLVIVNQNFWAMAALPVIWLAPYVKLKVPRIKWAFYVYYPLHLTIILILAHALHIALPK